MFNLDQDSTRRILKCPNYAHSFRERFQMMKADFKTLAIDDLFRSPGNRNAGTPGCHHHHVAIWTALKKTNVAVMRQNLRPEVQIGCRFEDRYLRRAHNN